MYSISTMNTQVSVKSTARDVFLYLFVTAALYAVAVSAISLLFQYVNHFFPEPFGWRGQVEQMLRVALSVLVIVTPSYVWAMRFLNKDLLSNPGKYHLGIRRWLVHLTLFASGVTIIIDLVTLVYNFLGGELTARFLLKILAVLIVAAVVFCYYIWDLRREAEALPQKMVWLARAVLVVLAGCVIGAFFIMESPKEQRARRLDEQRVTDLWTTQNIVESYWWQNGKLPETLETATDIETLPKDPDAGVVYEYQSISKDDYVLCATFALKGNDDAVGVIPPKVVGAPPSRDFLSHKEGRDCFSRSVKGLKTVEIR